MIRFLLISWLAASFLSAAGRADEVCPWLNSATAGGVLGGPVTVEVTHGSKDKEDGTCEYMRKNGAITYTLRIEVVTMTDIRGEFGAYLRRCGQTSTPMRAIGNEAVACALEKKAGQDSEQVVSRVRNRAFVVRVSTNEPSAKHTSLREQASLVAEQVAGNLF